MQAYLTAYDPAFDKASSGTILIVRYTRWAFDHGLRIVDFLRGDEAPSSLVWRTARSSCIAMEAHARCSGALPLRSINGACARGTRPPVRQPRGARAASYQFAISLKRRLN